jgi:hypothetical protein
MKKKQKIYVCGICDNDFTSPQGISAHVRNKHADTFEVGEIDNKGRLLTGWKKIEGVPPYVKGSSSLSPETIAAMRTEKDWLDCIDNVLVNSGIVPTCTAEKPNGMDRLESIEHLVKLVKQKDTKGKITAAESTPMTASMLDIPPAAAPEPWHYSILKDFEEAVREHEIKGMRMPDDHAEIDADYQRAKRLLALRFLLLKHRSEVADLLERELMQ